MRAFKVICIMLISVLSIGLLSGCSLYNKYKTAKDDYYDSLEDAPNSGYIEFNEVSFTIPDGYIRDSTIAGHEEGIARRWEQGNYKKIVTISKHEKYDINEDTLNQIKANQEQSMAVGDVDAQLIDFLDSTAIESKFAVTDGEMKYLIFNSDNYTYEFSVQGDTSDYDTIKNSIIYINKIEEENNDLTEDIDNQPIESDQITNKKLSQVKFDMPKNYELFNSEDDYLMYSSSDGNEIILIFFAEGEETLDYAKQDNPNGKDCKVNNYPAYKYTYDDKYCCSILCNGGEYIIEADNADVLDSILKTFKIE